MIQTKHSSKRTTYHPVHHRHVKETEKEPELKFTPLGGLEEIGRNMSVFEYGDEIIIFDMGFQFPEEDTPGIDYIIPNINSLIPKKDKIKALIITHGHYDHIGAIPYLINRLGPNIPIYAAALPKEIIKKRQEEFPNALKLNIETIKHGDRVRISTNIEVEFFEIEHTIPDSFAVLIKTPVGNMAYCADLKIDYDLEGNPKDLDSYREMGKRGIHTLFLESTGAERPGKSIPEALVIKNLDEIISKAEGRVIVGLFASLLTRVANIIQIAEKHDRKVFLSGLSLKNNVRIAQNLGYIKAKKGAIVNVEEIHKYRDEKILVLSTGAQGEPRASLMRIANGEHKYVSVKKGDVILFSS